MARPGGNPNLKGNKNSGRRPEYIERIKREVKEKAWLKKHAKMTDNDAIQIVLKDMSVKTELSGSVQLETITGTKIIEDNGVDIQNEDISTDKSCEVLE